MSASWAAGRRSARPPSGRTGRSCRSRCSGRSGPRSPRGSRPRGSGLLVQQRPRGEHHPRRAEAALEAVLLHEPLLDGIELGALLEVLDRAHRVAAGHRREHRARLHRLAVHQHDARPALRGVAAPVGAGEAERVAQEVDEEHPRLDVARASSPLTVIVTSMRQASSRGRGRRRARSARRVSSAARWRLYSTGRAGPPRGRSPRPRRRPASAIELARGACRAAGLRARERGRRADGGEREPGVGDRAAVEPDDGAGRGDRPVAHAALDLLVGAAGARAHGEADLGQQLPVAARRSRTARGGTPAMATTRSPPRPADHHLRVQRRADRREVLGRVGLAQRPADRPAVAHQRVGDRPARRRRRPGSARRASAESSRSRWRVSAPMRTSSPSRRM